MLKVQLDKFPEPGEEVALLAIAAQMGQATVKIEVNGEVRIITVTRTDAEGRVRLEE